MRPKLIRTATISLSLNYHLKGQLEFLSSDYEVIGVSGRDRYLDEVAVREGIRIVDLPMQRAISPFNDARSLLQLYRLFKKEKPLIVHSITPKAGLLSMTAAYLAGVPIRIHTFTGLIFPSKKGPLQKLLILMDKALCRFATHIFPEGQGVRNDLLRFNITNKPLKILANGNVNGVDLDFFSPESCVPEQLKSLKESLNILPDDFVFIFVGRLVTDKGINELVSVFKELSPDSGVKLLLVGDTEAELDPLYPETLEEIARNKHIITVGFKDDVRPYFSIADALVFPSHREGFPNVVLQAGAMGLPAIVTDISGCNEIIEQDKNGMIMHVGDTARLYESMISMMVNQNLYHHYKSNARKIIAEKYSREQVWSAVKQAYQEIVQELNTKSAGR